MKHLDDIHAYLKTLTISTDFHALIVQSLPGWGKSTTIEKALADLGIEAVSGGSYATPLHIYNTICRHSDAMVVFDDCAGVFGDTKAMAILKAATWPSSARGGTGVKTGAVGTRRIAWGSSSERVEQPSVDFRGKLILLTNALPAGKETEAFLSRCLNYHIRIDRDEARRMLRAAAQSKEHFRDTKISGAVVRFLLSASTRADFQRVNLRTLRMGYDIAVTHPVGWQELLIKLLPREDGVDSSIQRIFQSDLPSKDQEAKFLASTGLSRRSFFNYRKRMGLARAYRAKS